MKVNGKFKIKIVGIGDFGIDVIKDFGERNLPGVECIDMNTDWAFKTANRFVKLGVNATRGIGTGALVEFGKKAAEEDMETIIEAIKDCDLLIIVAGLGGGTGSGATPVVVQTAKELEIPTVAFVTLPFEFEGKIRKNNAQYGLENLKNVVDILIIMSGENFLEDNLNRKHASIVEHFEDMDEILKKNILKIVALFNSNESQTKSIQEILKEVEPDKTSYIKMLSSAKYLRC